MKYFLLLKRGQQTCHVVSVQSEGALKHVHTIANCEKKNLVGFFFSSQKSFLFLPFSTHLCKQQLTRYQRWFVSLSGLPPCCCLLVVQRLCLTHCFLCMCCLDAEMELNREIANTVYWALPKITSLSCMIPLYLFYKSRWSDSCTLCKKRREALFFLQFGKPFFYNNCKIIL